MKNLLFACFVMILLIGCNQPIKEKPDRDKENLKGDAVCVITGKGSDWTEFREFNDDGYLKRNVRVCWGNSEPWFFAEESFVYSKNRLEKIEYLSGDGRSLEKSQAIYTYDKKGKLISIRVESNKETTSTFKYENGLLTEQRSPYITGINVFQYSYSPNKMLLSKTILSYNRNEEPNYKRLLNYDASGKEINELNYRYEENRKTFLLTDSATILYNNNGDEKKRIGYDIENNQTNTKDIEYQYDTGGNWIEKTEKSNGEIYKRTREIFYKDQAPDEILTKFESLKSSKMASLSIKDYTKNTNNTSEVSKKQKVRVDSFKITDSTSYRGEMQNGKPNGIGTLYNKYGFPVHEGIWENGSYIGPVTFDPSKVTMEKIPVGGNGYYYGQVFNGEFYGEGKLYENGLLKAEGMWKKSVLVNGKEYADGKLIYEGEFKLGQYNGKGRLTRPDGTVVEGIWEMGRLLSESSDQSETSITKGNNENVSSSESNVSGNSSANTVFLSENDVLFYLNGKTFVGGSTGDATLYFKEMGSQLVVNGNYLLYQPDITILSKTKAVATYYGVVNPSVKAGLIIYGSENTIVDRGNNSTYKLN